MSRQKQDFYRAAARYHEASCRIYGVDAVVHLENDNDRPFWQQVFAHFRPRRRYRFIGASRSERGIMTSGCGMCLKYRRYLSRRFFVCIDSDLRWLLDRDGISASRGILQTYTYSWENHLMFAHRLHQGYASLRRAQPFDWHQFMRRYSHIVYAPMLLMLWTERQHTGVYQARDFNRDLIMTESHDDEQNSGQRFLKRLEKQFGHARQLIASHPEFDLTAEAAHYRHKGLKPDTAYLYVRGHAIYNAVRYIGHRLIGDRYETLQRRPLEYNASDPMRRIAADLNLIDHLPRK